MVLFFIVVALISALERHLFEHFLCRLDVLRQILDAELKMNSVALNRIADCVCRQLQRLLHCPSVFTEPLCRL